MTTVKLTDLARLREHGYKIERYAGTGGGWFLLDPDGDSLMVANYGCLSPTQWEAVAEGLRRIEQDERCETGLLTLALDDGEEALLRSALDAYRELCESFAAADPQLADEWLRTTTRIDALKEKLG